MKELRPSRNRRVVSTGVTGKDKDEDDDCCDSIGSCTGSGLAMVGGGGGGTLYMGTRWHCVAFASVSLLACRRVNCPGREGGMSMRASVSNRANISGRPPR